MTERDELGGLLCTHDTYSIMQVSYPGVGGVKWGLGGGEVGVTRQGPHSRAVKTSGVCI